MSGRAAPAVSILSATHCSPRCITQKTNPRVGLTLSSAARLRRLRRPRPLLIVMRRYLSGTGQHIAMRSAPCMRNPCMTSPDRSQIVATAGTEGRGTTTLPRRQPRPSSACGTAASDLRGAATATGVACIARPAPKPRHNANSSQTGVYLAISTPRAQPSLRYDLEVTVWCTWSRPSRPHNT